MTVRKGIGVFLLYAVGINLALIAGVILLSGGVKHVEILEIRVVESDSEFVVIDVLADTDVPALSSWWAAVAHLLYSVDDDSGADVGSSSGAWIRRPFMALSVGPRPPERDMYVSRWKIRQVGSTFADTAQRKHSLHGTENSILTFEFYGSAMVIGGSLASNALQISIKQ